MKRVPVLSTAPTPKVVHHLTTAEPKAENIINGEAGTLQNHKVATVTHTSTQAAHWPAGHWAAWAA